MSVVIDVVYQNGEAVAFNNLQNVSCSRRQKTLTLTRNLATDVVLRFCTAAGEALEVIAPENFGYAQILLSCRDRLLLAREEGITLETDEAGFQQLRISHLVPDSGEIANVLADSYLEIDPRRQGKVECDFSCAVYVGSDEQAMQLFFTLDALLKNAVLPVETQKDAIGI